MPIKIYNGSADLVAAGVPQRIWPNGTLRLDKLVVFPKSDNAGDGRVGDSGVSVTDGVGRELWTNGLNRNGFEFDDVDLNQVYFVFAAAGDGVEWYGEVRV